MINNPTFTKQLRIILCKKIPYSKTEYGIFLFYFSFGTFVGFLRALLVTYKLLPRKIPVVTALTMELAVVVANNPKIPISEYPLIFNK